MFFGMSKVDPWHPVATGAIWWLPKMATRNENARPTQQQSRGSSKAERQPGEGQNDNADQCKENARRLTRNSRRVIARQEPRRAAAILIRAAAAATDYERNIILLAIRENARRARCNPLGRNRNKHDGPISTRRSQPPCHRANEGQRIDCDGQGI